MARPYKKKIKPITLVKQQQLLKNIVVTKSTSIVNGCLYWFGSIQPSPLSAKYELKLVYKIKKELSIYLLSPKLSSIKGKNVPHLYNVEKQKLCLFRPAYHEWTPDMYLSETIIPWSAEWLIYYELWIATGEWLGGGEHVFKKDISA